MAEAFMELQGRLLDTDRKMKQLLQQEKVLENESRRAKLTLQELESLPTSTRTYKGVGKAFVLEPLAAVKAEEEKVLRKCADSQASLKGSKAYVEKQMQEVQASFKELMQQVPGMAQQLMHMQAGR